MHNILTVSDAIALLERSSLPTVVTEGSSDYRVMRKMEDRLADLGVDFLPVGGRSVALEVWEKLSPDRIQNTMVLVDLDMWLYEGIPEQYSGKGISYTIGYSIENDIFLDSNIIDLCDVAEKLEFSNELKIVSAWYARQIERASRGEDYKIDLHVNQVIGQGNIFGQLDADEIRRYQNIENNFEQMLRGKNLFELLIRQLSRADRYVKYGYKHVYDVASTRLGPIFDQIERNIRAHIGEAM